MPHDSMTAWFKSVYFLPGLVLAVSLSATYLLGKNAQHETANYLQADFDFRVREAKDHVEQRLLAYEQVLRGAQGLFAASASVTRDEFHSYAANQHLEQSYPGIQGMGISLIVPPEKMNQHIAAIRKESGHPEYTIRPEGKRNVYTSIIYLEPFSGRNLRAFGYDMYSEPVRRAAMEQARDSGKASLSGKVKLVQETEQNVQAGFLMYLPLYRNGTAHDTVADRRANIIGWAYAPFRMNDLMRGIEGERGAELDVEIYDGNESDQALMYDADNSRYDRLNARLQTVTPMDIAGHRWTLRINSYPPFEARLDTHKAEFIALTGTAASLLLALLTWSLARGRERAEQAARKMNKELIRSEERARLAISASHSALYDYDLVTGRVYLSEAWSELLGGAQQPTHTTMQELTELAPEEERGMIRSAVLEAIKGHDSSSYHVMHRVKKLDGGYIWVLSEGHITERTPDGRALRMVGTNRDITERKTAEEKLKNSEASLRAILDNSPYLIWLKDTEGRFMAVNKAFFKTTGLATIQDVLGKTDYDLWPEELARKYRADDADVLSTRKQKLTEEMSMDNGEVHWVETFKAPIMDKNGDLLGTTGFAQDITGRKNAEGKIRHLAHYDPLTDLPNRALFSDRLQQALAIARRDKTRIALMFLDLDKFKPINDTLGHHVGDLLLKEVAERMQDSVRESDTVARIGGDEFVILLPVIEAVQDAMLVAEKIRAALNQPFVLVGQSLNISSSTGIAVYPEHGKDETQLFKNADIAMYHAKEGGRNCVKIYQAEMQDGA